MKSKVQIGLIFIWLMVEYKKRGGIVMNMVNFGKMISKLRRKNKLTQKELADQLKISDKAVSRWENGLSYPDIVQLPRISKIFGVSIDYLLNGNARGITIAGNIVTDILNAIDKAPRKNNVSNIVSVDRFVGGCVPNTAINLAKIDPELFISVIGKVGYDENGKFVVSQMKKNGIDVSGVLFSEEDATSFSYVMTEVESGEQTTFLEDSANKTLNIPNFDIESLDCEIFHIGHICFLDELNKSDDKYGTRLARLLSEISEKGIKISIDDISDGAGDCSEKIIPILKYCDIVIMSDMESSAIAGISVKNPDDIKKVMSKFFEYGVREKVIIRSDTSAYLMTADGKVVDVPFIEISDECKKGKLGYDEAFAAGCIYGIYSGYENAEILEFAVAARTVNMSAVDSVSGMKTKDELEFMIQEQRKNNI